MKKQLYFILFIFLTATIDLFSQTNFDGQYEFKKTQNETSQFNKLIEFTNKKKPYERYLNNTLIYTLHKDTLILEQYDSLGELYYVNIQIGKSLFTKSILDGNKFVDVSNYNHFDICKISKWERLDSTANTRNNRSRYKGYVLPNENTKYEIEVLNNDHYIFNLNYGGNFCKLFSKYGSIVSSTRTYQDRDENCITTIKMIDSIRDREINCKAIFKKHNFKN